MSSRHTSRTRLAIILALAVVLSSDAALAALVCATHGMGCHSGAAIMGEQSATGAAAADSEMRGMACCPSSSEVDMQCADPAMRCCTLEQGGAQTAVVVSKFSPTPRKMVSSLPASATAGLGFTTGQNIDRHRSDISGYIQPVDQKKTDLRI